MVLPSTRVTPITTTVEHAARYRNPTHENGAQSSVHARIVDQRIEIPTLDRRLRSHPAWTLRPRVNCPVVRARRAARICGISCAVDNLWRGEFGCQWLVRSICEAVVRASVNCLDRFLHF